MLCAKCIVIGSANNLVLIPKRFVIYEIMNKLVAFKSKRQHTNSLFILHLNFNNLEALLLLVPILVTKPPWKIFLHWEI